LIYGEGEESGEAIWMEFAGKHANVFEDGFDEPGKEQKLEYTAIHKEF
jgi:GH18 family chitinase